jgi:hypothetical protein
MLSRSPFSALSLVIGALVLASFVGPVAVVPASATASASASAAAPPVTVDPGPLASNPFIRDDVNIGDCVNLLPLPNCGSDQRSGYHQYVTFIILLLATVFIGWRITRGVRARDRETSPPPKTPSSTAK